MFVSITKSHSALNIHIKRIAWRCAEEQFIPSNIISEALGWNTILNIQFKLSIVIKRFISMKMMLLWMRHFIRTPLWIPKNSNGFHHFECTHLSNIYESHISVNFHSVNWTYSFRFTQLMTFNGKIWLKYACAMWRIDFFFLFLHMWILDNVALIVIRRHCGWNMNLVLIIWICLMPSKHYVISKRIIERSDGTFILSRRPQTEWQ